MLSLRFVRENNLLLASAGVNFVNPKFRMLAGQFPYEIGEVHTIFFETEDKGERKFKRLLDQTKNAFLVIMRNEDARLADVVFVPPKEQRQGTKNLPRPQSRKVFVR